MNDFTVSFVVPESADDVFAAINNVRGWWSGDIEGSTDALGAEFTYRYEKLHRSTQRITEFVPGRRVAWHVVDGYLEFVAEKDEWTGTDITFDITPSAAGTSAGTSAGTEAGTSAGTSAGTEVRFTHVGLSSDGECFESCSSAWGFYINSSLRNLITKGKGAPNQ